MAAVADNDVGQQTQPEPEPEPEQLTVARVKIVCNSGTVNIRVGNGTDYASITAVADGTEFEHVATAANGWHAVTLIKKKNEASIEDVGQAPFTETLPGK